jgi:hypothetical protein
MNLLIHLENADRIGILPSQLDEVRIMAKGLGIERLAYIDLTTDGHLFSPEWERFRTLKDWLSQVKEPMVVFETENVPRSANIEAVSVEKLNPSENSWVVFGPSAGFNASQFKDEKVTWCYIPTVVMSARDAVPIGISILAQKSNG